MWSILTILATKVDEAESFWKNALYDRIARKSLHKICLHTYVLQIEPEVLWAKNCLSVYFDMVDFDGFGNKSPS